MDDVSLFVNKLIKSAMMAFLLIFFLKLPDIPSVQPGTRRAEIRMPSVERALLEHLQQRL
jgi:hypothetical protein